MEGTAMSWVIGLFALGIGTGLGVLLARSVFKGSDNKKAEALQQEVDQIKNQHQEYRQSVDDHFEKTSELVFEMTQYYRKVYDHLSDGAQKLCLNPPEQLRADASQGKLYEAQTAADQLTHRQEVAEEEAAATQAAPEEAAAESAPAQPEQPPEEEKAAGEEAAQPAKAASTEEASSETGIELEVQEKQPDRDRPTLH